ncbi:hypothetical protein FACS1894167_05770 [Synergistales bacterium]|nr:hypothetical protein FACS1894167_05770 [Synergistales bacterium]
MARKTKIEKIAETDKQIQELEAYKKKLEAEQREDERRKRTNRLCERGGFIESVMPETVKLDKAQFQEFIKNTLLTPFSQRILAQMLPLKPQEPAEETSETPRTVPAPSVANAEKASNNTPKLA